MLPERRRKRSSRRLRTELTLDARELENLVLECGECACRIEVTPNGGIREGVTCPQCGGKLDAQR